MSIDIGRATAIMLMIQCHFMSSLAADYSGPWEWLLEWSVDILGYFPAPMFTFLVGLSLFLWEQKTKYEKEESTIVKYWLKRGFFIFIFGIVFEVVIWTPGYPFQWEILTLIGSSTLFIFVLRKTPVWKKICIAGAILLASPPFREAANYNMHWTESGYVYNFTVHDVVLGCFLQGYYPLLPWFIFPLLGYATGEYFFDKKNRNRLENWDLGIYSGILIVLAYIGAFFSDYMPVHIAWYVSDFKFFPATTTFIIAGLGFSLGFIWILYRMLDMKREAPKGPIVNFFSRYSHYSLSTYVIHWAAIMWPLYIAGWVTMEDIWYYYEGDCHPLIALALALAFIVIFYFVLIIWDRKKGMYSFEWMLKKLSH
jgi:uncharacterized membrane protein